ncbi:hypothetical protein QJQ45_024858 [Haematococcus lacustris]|nr:hypothetical protein QJQ45_024858 [Haematococcus lacustris]
MPSRTVLPLLLLLAGATAGLRSQSRRPRFRSPLHRQVAASSLNTELLAQCEQRFRNATLDHFNWGPGDLNATTYSQRYFVCGEQRQPSANGLPGPIFLYLGNEADVTLYLNNTGLMWENAAAFYALLVFAEHRYYGKSVPYGGQVRRHMRYLSAEQAMADYAELVAELKQEFNAPEAPVIAFGGSYGGMLAAWMRMKYPHVVDGAIAGSAPIWTFEGDTPAYDSLSFSKGVTHDASSSGGAPRACAGNVRAGWKLLDSLGATQEGRTRISAAMRLCPDSSLNSTDDVLGLKYWLASAWDYMAMGNFPYPSGYILNGHGQLPAYPVRVACSLGLHHYTPSSAQLLEGMAQAAGMYYNYSGSLSCLNWNQGANSDSDEDADFWDYQFCTEMFGPSARDGVHDMFWEEVWDGDAAAEGCQLQWGVSPRRTWAVTEWGGHNIGSASNIAFSNGLLDPWHGGGVLHNISHSLVAIIIPEGAHHIDLMFSHPLDPPSVIHARQMECSLIRQWVAQAQARSKGRKQRQPGWQLAPEGGAWS